ncbi:MAG: hypothetical protein ABI724_02410 [Betaproteobacteria bacterium]
MPEPRSPIRALVASFLFIDLVGFSKGTVAEQYAAKSVLSAILRDNLAALQESDYRVKDTGDGALIIFLSNPEHALYMALAITQDFARASSTPGVASKSLRTGLNIGTVKEQMDLEARPNYIGDGINDAKRIMDFADPGQIAASRSFYESVSCLDAMYARLFSHLGAPDDKHGRAHELYGVTSDPAVLEKLKRDFATSSPESMSVPVEPPRSTGQSKLSGSTAGANSGVATGEPSAADRAPVRPRATFLKPSMLLVSLGLVVVAVVVASAYVALKGWRAEPVTGAASPTVRPSSSGVAPSTGTASPSPGSEGKASPAQGGVAGSAPPPTSAGPSSAPPTAKPDVATVAPAAKDVQDASATRNPPPVAALPAATSVGVGTPVKVPPPPAARQPAMSATGDQGAARCRRIIQKAELGEPLSAEEKKELANSCR